MRAKDGVQAAREEIARQTGVAKSAIAAKVTRVATTRKEVAADRLESLANVAHQTAHVLKAARMEMAGEYVEKTAAAVDNVTQYIEEGDVE